jgi:hypothetical protein
MMWRAPCGERVLWLLDQQVERRGRRRLLLAVDTSDSCWPSRQPEIQAVIRTITTNLQRQDECRLWILGHSTPVVQAPLEDDTESARAALSHRLCGALLGERGGTWLRETADAMFETSRVQSDAIDYLLLVTDGADIFDAEGVPGPPSGVGAAIFSLPHINGAGGEGGGVTAVPIAGWERAPGDLARWFALVNASVRLEWAASAGVGYRFDNSGYVDPVPVNWPQPLEGGFARYTFLADDAPDLRLVTARGERQWTDVLNSAPHDVDDLQALPRELQGVAKRVRGLQLEWRTDVFEALASARATVISCPNCRASYSAVDVRDGKRVFCELCRAFMLVSGWARRDDPGLRWGVEVVWSAATGATVSTEQRENVGSLVIPLDRAAF